MGKKEVQASVVTFSWLPSPQQSYWQIHSLATAPFILRRSFFKFTIKKTPKNQKKPQQPLPSDGNRHQRITVKWRCVTMNSTQVLRKGQYKLSAKKESQTSTPPALKSDTTSQFKLLPGYSIQTQWAHCLKHILFFISFTATEFINEHSSLSA